MNRRTFLKCASLAAGGSLVGLTPFGRLTALAQGAQYQALVCLFLNGGNDSNNMVIPADNATYGLYHNARQTLAIPQDQLLPLKNLSFGFHPSMPELQALFNSSKVAIVANVGTLTQPLTIEEARDDTSPKLPQCLESHPDQQAEWGAASTSTGSTIGWGGAIADLMGDSYGSTRFPMVTSVAGLNVFAAGKSSSPFVYPSSSGQIWCVEGNICDERLQTAQQLLQIDSGITLVQADNSLTSQMYSYIDVFSQAVAQAPRVKTVFPQTDLGTQLSQIAQIMQARNNLGAQKQIFFAQLQGFDTHGDQLGTHAGLLAQVSAAVNAFYTATVEMGIEDQVVLFTASDFNRALVPNYCTGSDHAWGGHQLVVGGGVKGGMYGTFPQLVCGGPDDITTTGNGSTATGRWRPTSSVSQYGATHASCLGVSNSDLNTIFPSLSNFSNATLGFL